MFTGHGWLDTSCSQRRRDQETVFNIITHGTGRENAGKQITHLNINIDWTKTVGTQGV